MGDDRRFYEAAAAGARRSAPAAQRNREPIAKVLADWLPEKGLVVEIASGTGEHSAYFAERFPALDWQPSDIHPDALVSITAWRDRTACANLMPPLVIDAAAADWTIKSADAVLCINMVHISPWRSAIGLLDGSERLLSSGAPLILYGPWISAGTSTASSNLAFDADLKRRDPQWGLRKVDDFVAAAADRRFVLQESRAMPANNLMLLMRRS